MLLSDWSMLNKSFIEQPPTDLLVAWFLGFKPTNSGRSAAGRQNAENLAALPKGAFPMGRMKTLDQAPEFLRNPRKMELIARMKAEATGEAHGGS